VLETVVAGHQILGQNTDGSYTALPLTTGDWLRVRVEADRPDLVVGVDGTDLPKRNSGATAWSDAKVTPSTGSRPWFEDIAVQLPASKLRPPSGSERLTVRYSSFPGGTPDPGTLAVDLVSTDPSIRASDVVRLG
jgi:hypothetical protein